VILPDAGLEPRILKRLALFESQPLRCLTGHELLLSIRFTDALEKSGRAEPIAHDVGQVPPWLRGKAVFGRNLAKNRGVIVVELHGNGVVAVI
jgi:hypothetical protein